MGPGLFFLLLLRITLIIRAGYPLPLLWPISVDIIRDMTVSPGRGHCLPRPANTQVFAKRKLRPLTLATWSCRFTAHLGHTSKLCFDHKGGRHATLGKATLQTSVKGPQVMVATSSTSVSHLSGMLYLSTITVSLGSSSPEIHKVQETRQPFFTPILFEQEASPCQSIPAPVWQSYLNQPTSKTVKKIEYIAGIRTRTRQFTVLTSFLLQNLKKNYIFQIVSY